MYSLLAISYWLFPYKPFIFRAGETLRSISSKVQSDILANTNFDNAQDPSAVVTDPKHSL